LRQIREDGYSTTRGEFLQGIVGIAAPLFNGAGDVLGSLGLAMAASKLKRAELPALATAVIKAAQDATARIGSGEHGVDLPARAVG
jgi:DNA-binding IclR family transcriptional regulator